MGRPTRQSAEVMFQREEWNKAELAPRVVAIRSRERDNGKQLYLWNDLEYTAQCWLTNNLTATGEEVADVYNDRAGIEPLIAELKNNWCIGKAPSGHFDANHAAFLVKLLAYNLFRRYIDAHYPHIAWWRTAWLRRTIILRPGRLVRSGRQTVVHTTPAVVPMLR
jgi:IS4 transposase